MAGPSCQCSCVRALGARVRTCAQARRAAPRRAARDPYAAKGATRLQAHVPRRASRRSRAHRLLLEPRPAPGPLFQVGVRKRAEAHARCGHSSGPPRRPGGPPPCANRWATALRRQCEPHCLPGCGRVRAPAHSEALHEGRQDAARLPRDARLAAHPQLGSVRRS